MSLVEVVIIEGDEVVVEVTENVVVRTAGVGTVYSVNGLDGDVILDADGISDSATTHKFTNAVDSARLAATSGTNTGDETTSTIKSKLGITTLSGSNTGDQTLPVGGTPAITLGTTNTAGSSPNFLRRDDTILTFDATAPSTQAFGDSATVGTATVAARRDHKHAMMATPDLTSLATKAGLQTESYTAANATGMLGAYAITITPTPSLTTYSWFSFKANSSNAGAATLAINGGSAIPIKKLGGTDYLAYGDITTGQIVRVIYDGTNFQMQSQVATDGLYSKSEYDNGTVTTALIVSPTHGSHQKVTLTQAQTCVFTFVQPTSGTAVIGLKIIQSATTPFNGTISGGKWPGGITMIPTISTGAIDLISIYLDGTNAYCTIVGQDLK